MSSWPIVALREVADQVVRAERPDPDQRYRIAGVRLWGEGAYERATILGSETQYAQLFRLEEDDIVVNKIWARNGSVSVVDSELAGAFGSPEFPTYALDKAQLNPRWFLWFTRHPSLWKQCELLSRGTSGQNRLKPERFLEVVIPLPEIEVQRALVTRLDAAASLVARRSRTAADVDSEIGAMLRSAFNRISTGVPRASLREIAPLVRRPVTIDPDTSYPEVGVRSFGRGLFTKPDLLGAELTWQSLYRIESGDLVFSNIKAWEGAFAVADSEHHDKYGSHRYLTCVPDLDRTTAGYVWYYLQSREGLDQIGRASPGSADRNRTLATKRLEAISVPLPSLDAQLWFDEVHVKARAARMAQLNGERELEKLLPAMLHEVFAA